MLVYLIGLAVALSYAASLYIWPFKNCGWCKGTGRRPGSNSRRFGNCLNPRCQRGTVQRLGSKTIHRAARALISYVCKSRQNREK